MTPLGTSVTNRFGATLSLWPRVAKPNCRLLGLTQSDPQHRPQAPFFSDNMVCPKNTSIPNNTKSACNPGTCSKPRPISARVTGLVTGALVK